MSPSPRTAAIDRVDRVHYQRGDKQPPVHSTIPPASHTCSPRCQICGRLCSFRAIRARTRIIVHVGASRDRHWRWRMTLDDHESHVTLSSTVPLLIWPALCLYSSSQSCLCAFGRRRNLLSVPYLESVTKPPTSARRYRGPTELGSQGRDLCRRGSQ
jgi:hypothetical protein